MSRIRSLVASIAQAIWCGAPKLASVKCPRDREIRSPTCCLEGNGYVILTVVCGANAMSMKNGDNKRPQVSDWAGLVLVGQLGLTVAIPILLGIGAGLFIDSKLQSSPIATLLGLLLGLAAGVYGAYRLISRLE